MPVVVHTGAGESCAIDVTPAGLDVVQSLLALEVSPRGSLERGGWCTGVQCMRAITGNRVGCGQEVGPGRGRVVHY
eukprot:scaffold201219_cov26-Tisochrysis_lutea.AAC.1